MMSGSAISVRCLASTRILKCDVQEEDQNETKEEYQCCEGLVEVDEREKMMSSHDEAQHQSREDELEDGNNDGHSDTSFSPGPSIPSLPLDSETEDDSDSVSSESSLDSGCQTSCTQEAQLSPDGSCVFTSDYSHQFSVYPISNDILTQTSPRNLAPYASLRSSDPIWAFAVNPLFNLQDASSTTVLLSRRDTYIGLHNALWGTSRTGNTEGSSAGAVDISTPLASYKLINNLTEAVTAPLSLVYSNDGTHFFAGAKDEIAIFDLQDTEKPIYTMRTISALALSPPSHTSHDGLLAAGSRTRYIGIYDPVGGNEITHFSLPGTTNGVKFRNEKLNHVMGDGVSSLKCSPCGKYLYVAERSSDVLLIYDVRNFSLSLGYCAGRKALTRQKLGFDIWNAGGSPYDIEGISHEVWAGGTDGMVRVWRDPYVREGAVEADEVFAVNDGEVPVVASLVHASGSLAVAACGAVGAEEEMKGRGLKRGGALRPRVREWGSLDFLGLG